MVEKEKLEKPETVGRTIRHVRRATRKKYTAEEKIRVVRSGLRHCLAGHNPY